MGIRNKRKKKRPYKNNKITTRSFVKMEDLKKFYFKPNNLKTKVLHLDSTNFLYIKKLIKTWMF